MNIRTSGAIANPTNDTVGTTPAVVLCGGGLGAYDIVRTLGEAGIPSLVFASHRDDVAFRSRYARGALLLPEFRAANFEEILSRISAHFANKASAERPVLFHAGDSETLFVSRYRDILKKWFRFVLPPPDLVDRVTSKARFVDLAREAKLPVPPSRAFADVAELTWAIGTLQFPCIVKPARNQDWFWETNALRARFGGYKDALRRFNDAGALRDFCAGLPRRRAALVVQSYIDGRDEQLASFHGYFDEHSRCLGYFLTRTVRTNPPHSGDTTFCELFQDDALAALSQECLAKIGFQGIVKIDYKRDARTGRYYLLEIEPHYQTAHLLGACAGINLARIAYCHACGEPEQPPVTCDNGYRLLDLREDLKAYWHGYRKTKEWSGAGYLRSLLGKNQYRLFNPRDPGPFLYAGFSYLRSKFLRTNRVAPRVLPGVQ